MTGQLSATRGELCTCGEGRNQITDHADNCALFDCDYCGAKFLAGEEHKPDCAERCPHCHSEGVDNDHREGCPTLGTCAQTCPWIPVEEGWHTDPEPFTTVAQDAHMVEFHPEPAALVPGAPT